MEVINKYKLKSLFSPAMTGRTEYSADEILLTIETMPKEEAIPVEWMKEALHKYCAEGSIYYEVVDLLLKDWEKENDR